MPNHRPSRRSMLLAIDTGGTFTDFFLASPQGVRTHKVLSTPQNPSLAIFQGIRDLGIHLDIEIIHGSTVATNAFLESKGARVALITTAGFEDVLEIGRQNRPHLYDFQTERTPPLVPAHRRLGVRERINAQGKVEEKLLEKDLRAILNKLKKTPCDSIAICLLFSYANSTHEQKVKKKLAALKKTLSVSSEICPEYREFERSSTTCINAYVAPIMSGYLGSLRKTLTGPIRIMQSNGGSLSIEEASGEAVRTLLSGPAGGALGAYEVARQAGYPKVITLDMGGTSTDMTLIDGKLELTTETSLGGLPIKTPMIRMDTIGAGGGSLAWTDKGGALRVGPKSAGALPGPICYGRGGRQVTITDAHVFLGRIPPGHFLGGNMKLQTDKIQTPLKELSHPLKLSLKNTAQGILTVANNNMARALRVLSLERGYDPREFTLLPFGGAGSLHACELAELLGSTEVLVPVNPGILSAYGMAHADWVRDYVHTVLMPEAKAQVPRLKNKIDGLKRRARQDAAREGIPKKQLSFLSQLDVRYRGQSYELTVPFGPRYKSDFKKAHRRYYGFLHHQELEVVNIRLQARLPFVHSHLRATKLIRKEKFKAFAKTKLFWNHKEYLASVFERKDLNPGGKIKGPAIIAEYSATTFIPPGWEMKCDPFLNLAIKKL